MKKILWIASYGPDRSHDTLLSHVFEKKGEAEAFVKGMPYWRISRMEYTAPYSPGQRTDEIGGKDVDREIERVRQQEQARTMRRVSEQKALALWRQRIRERRSGGRMANPRRKTRRRPTRNPYVRLDKVTKQIMKAAFPDWKGREVKIQPHESTINLASYWDGGSRDFFAFVRLPDLKAAVVPQQSMFDKPIAGIKEYKMQPGILVVRRGIYRGKEGTPVIYVHPDNLSQISLPAPAVALDLIHALALLVTRRYISSARYDNFRDWTNASKAQYDAVRKDLQAMGLLKKNNSLTTDGKNVTDQWTDEYALLRAYGIDPVEYLKKTRGR